MKIYSMTATFGKLEHETLTLQPGLNVIHAPNEWGKSTWCAFLAAMLYGIETRVHSTKTALADKERYAPWSGSPMSGRMELCWNGRDITIERASRGRSIFGIFRAYETQSGLPVAELTADNCGQQLLGVEKSVFLRAGFLKLTDLPVSEDKALWRRLNALVTTGDESGAADALEQKLRDLKNRCRANRANGLIPQALAQQAELTDKLQQLRTLQAQEARLTQRQQELQVYTAQLENHKKALDYQASLESSRKAAAAMQQLQLAQEQVAQQEAICRELPDPDAIYQQLSLLQQLRQQRESLQMEVQMQPGTPEIPEAPAPFRGCSPQQALRQATEDTKLYEECQKAKKPHSAWMFILGFCLVGLGLVGFAMLPQKVAGIGLMALGAILAAVGLISHSNQLKKYRDVQATVQKLLAVYGALDVSKWISTAQDYADRCQAYTQAMARHAEDLAHIRQDAEAVNQKLETLTGGMPYLQWEQKQRDALDAHKALSNAIRQYKQAESLHQALNHAPAQVQPPADADPLTYSPQETLQRLSEAAGERHQLQLQLGRCHGQMESLGQEETILSQLKALDARLQKLNETYAALELAQQTAAQASAQLQRRFAPKLAKRTQELFGKLTGNRYDRLTLGEDLSLMVAAQQEDTLHSSLWRSDGTTDQLYLALRLAVAEELTPNAPLVLDDALVRFDDTRLAAAMEILKEEAQDKQVILFTCQSRESQYM